jgi:exopolysaccharide production protein ExoZ
MRLHNVQVLRALAAFAVVCHHVLDCFVNYFAAVAPLSRTTIFACGVDVFFVISGFIIAQSSFGKPLTPLGFLRARTLRVAPIYALLTLAAFVGRKAGLNLFAQPDSSAKELISSLLFVPIVDAAGAVHAPVLFVGWSLNYEMLFYLVFALALLLHDTRMRLAGFAAAMVCLVLVASVTSNPYLRYWGSPIVLEFLFGILVWRLWTKGRASPVQAFTVGALALLALGVPAVLELSIAHADEILVRGVPAAALVWSAVSLEQSGLVLRSRFLELQGDSSYSLYLTHPFVLQVLCKLSAAAGLSMTVAGQLGFAVVALTAAGIVGTVFHLKVERTLGRWLRPLSTPVLQPQPASPIEHGAADSGH